MVGLKENTSLEEIGGYGDHDEDVQFHLQLNRWFNRNRTKVTESQGSFTPGNWPYILAKVSSNVNALHDFVRGYPAIVDRACSSRKRCIDEA